jgi:hypothetical protein
MAYRPGQLQGAVLVRHEQNSGATHCFPHINDSLQRMEEVKTVLEKEHHASAEVRGCYPTNSRYLIPPLASIYRQNRSMFGFRVLNLT